MTKHGPALWHLVPPPTPAVGAFAYRPPKRSWYRRRRVQVAVVTAALLLIVAAFAG
jgi:hypothetical protein